MQEIYIREDNILTKQITEFTIFCQLKAVVTSFINIVSYKFEVGHN